VEALSRVDDFLHSWENWRGGQRVRTHGSAACKLVISGFHVHNVNFTVMFVFFCAIL